MTSDEAWATLQSIDEATCLHDGTRQHAKCLAPERTTTEVTCDQCGALLCTYEMDLCTISHTTMFNDDVYELLYTHQGRLALVVACLEHQGAEPPWVWKGDRYGIR